MDAPGAGAPVKHVRGFCYPGKEKPEIQGQRDELEARQHSDQAALESGDAAEGTRSDEPQLTD